jgi:enoyl-CoA hydratase/carnithine racemase
MAGIALLRELVRADVARELVYSGRIVQAEEACQLGLVTAVHADPLAQARAFAQQVAARNPDAVRADKRLLNAMTDGDEAALLLAESTEQQVILGSANQREAVRAQQERRAPAFTPAQA